MKRGEVWLVALPFTAGKEQSGQRPAVVAQDAIYGQRSPLVLVVPLTSQLAALRFPATLRIDPSVENGLSVPSVAMVFQTRAVDRSRFLRSVGELGSEDVARLVAELARLTGLPV